MEPGTTPLPLVATASLRFESLFAIGERVLLPWLLLLLQLTAAGAGAGAVMHDLQCRPTVKCTWHLA